MRVVCVAGENGAQYLCQEQSRIDGIRRHVTTNSGCFVVDTPRDRGWGVGAWMERSSLYCLLVSCLSALIAVSTPFCWNLLKSNFHG